MQLILWPEGAYTDDTYATKPESRSHIRIHFMNHDYIGSFWQCQMSQKTTNLCHSTHLRTAGTFLSEVKTITAIEANNDTYCLPAVTEYKLF